MEIIVNGILFGLGLSVLIGPVLLLYLELGISQGFKAGLSLAGGVWISDILIIYVLYNFLSTVSHFLQHTTVSFTIGSIGGILLIGCGGVGLYQQHQNRKLASVSVSATSYSALFAKGFVLNIFNPFAFIFWIGVMGSMIVQERFDTYAVVLFFSCLIITVIIFDILKIYLARCIRTVLTPSHIKRIKGTISVGLVVFGIGLIIRLFLAL